VVFQDIVAVGQSKEFTAARQIQLTLGNAGAVDLVVNGRHLGAPGANGSVVHLVFTPADGGGSGSAGSG
jgi:hypothetical protein